MHLLCWKQCAPLLTSCDQQRRESHQRPASTTLTSESVSVSGCLFTSSWSVYYPIADMHLRAMYTYHCLIVPMFWIVAMHARRQNRRHAYGLKPCCRRRRENGVHRRMLRHGGGRWSCRCEDRGGGRSDNDWGSGSINGLRTEGISTAHSWDTANVPQVVPLWKLG